MIFLRSLFPHFLKRNCKNLQSDSIGDRQIDQSSLISIHCVIYDLTMNFKSRKNKEITSYFFKKMFILWLKNQTVLVFLFVNIMEPQILKFARSKFFF